MKKIFLIIVLILFKSNFLLADNIEIINDTKGDGLKVVNHSWVKIEYTGSFEDGTVFDTNVGKDKPLVFQIGMKEVIPGFEQGIIGTNKGSKRKIKIPAQLAYGEKGAGELIPPNSNLIFEFKILDVLSPNYEKINSEKLEKLIPQSMETLVDFVGKWRPEVKAKLGSIERRRWFWERLLRSNQLERAIERGGESAPENLVFKELRNRGYLDKMSKYLRNLKDEELSLT